MNSRMSSSVKFSSPVSLNGSMPCCTRCCMNSHHTMVGSSAPYTRGLWSAPAAVTSEMKAKYSSQV